MSGTKAEAQRQARDTRAALLALQEIQPERRPEWYRMSELGSGRLFADYAMNKARYVPERGRWFIYEGGIWKPDPKDSRVEEWCKCLADALLIYSGGIDKAEVRDSYREYALKWQSRRYRKIVIDDAFSEYPIHAEDLDANPNLFNCRNGTLDLETMTFWNHDPEDMLTIRTGVKYDPAAECPRWTKFIDEVTEGDLQRALYLQAAMGYGLTGEAEEECMFILYGPTTRNGKSTAMEVYSRLLGGYARTAEPETLTQRKKFDGGAPSEDLARLAGARVVTISEPAKQMILDAARVKTLTGHDRVTVRFLHENSFEYVPQFKLFMNTNHLPKINDLSLFTSDRIKVIPFERHFFPEEQDKGLKKKLTRAEELSGILNWCLRGLKAVRSCGGLNTPPSVVAAIEKYRKDSDKIARFIEDMLEPDPAGEIRTEDAYKFYQLWCQRNGHYPENMTNFKQAMEGYAEIRKKRPAGAGREATKLQLILGYKWKCGPMWSGENH